MAKNPACSVCGATSEGRKINFFDPYAGVDTYGPKPVWFCLSCVALYELYCMEHRTLMHAAYVELVVMSGTEAVGRRRTQDINACCPHCVMFSVDALQGLRRRTLLSVLMHRRMATTCRLIAQAVSRSEIEATHPDIASLYGLMVHASLLGHSPEDYLASIGAYAKKRS